MRRITYCELRIGYRLKPKLNLNLTIIYYGTWK